MELVAPAGNLEKLKTAYLYGADAAYIGLPGFSLRAKTDNIGLEDLAQAASLKGTRKLYGAFNVYFSDADIRALEETLDALDGRSFDAFIISDPGVIGIFRKYFPATPLHLSTQANCTNSNAARLYRDLGFERIILARELSLKEIEEIANNSRIALEVFVHGAMCLAYSGRCFLSAYMAERSANKGDCAHVCRWDYRILEESERPGEYFPVFEGDDFTSILSSKDLCMIDHLAELRDAGVSAVKIEGRMKSVYYTAVTTRAYRKAIDKLMGKTDEDIGVYKQELLKVSHREFSTGFFFNRNEIEKPTLLPYVRDHVFLGSIGEKTDEHVFRIDVKNQIRLGDELEYIGFDVVSIQDGEFSLLDEEKNSVSKIDHGKVAFLKTQKPVKPGYLIRKKV